MLNYRFWMITMCQDRFINYNKHTTLVEEVTRVWGRGNVENIFPLSFAVKLKFLFKKKKCSEI